MAVLEDSQGQRTTVGSQCLIGRAPHCRVCLADKRVSWDQARISWLRDGWWLRDLNSTNGTWVDGRRLGPDDRVALSIGQKICFGHHSIAFRVDNIDPPRFRLRSLTDTRVICPKNTLVGLPSDDDPRLTVCLGVRGWSIEDGSQVRLLVDQEVIEFGQERWQVELPPTTDDVAETGTQRDQALIDIRDLTLELHVTVDREDISAIVTVNGRAYHLPNRSHHELLLLLVEARMSAQQRALPDDEAGWMTLDEATRSAGVGINKLNLDIFRLRREFEGLGLRDPRQLVERRETRREIRVGTGRLSVRYQHPSAQLGLPTGSQ
jgi:pSer/pThr/pTyr-binding forkhead associated (FHA) protein